MMNVINPIHCLLLPESEDLLPRYITAKCESQEAFTDMGFTDKIQRMADFFTYGVKTSISYPDVSIELPRCIQELMISARENWRAFFMFRQNDTPKILGNEQREIFEIYGRYCDLSQEGIYAVIGWLGGSQ